MYNYRSKWEDFEKILNEEKSRVDNLYGYQMERYKRNLLLSCGHISVFLYFNDKYQLEDNYLKRILSPYLYLFSLEEKQIVKILDAYIENFGSVDNLLRYLNEESIICSNIVQPTGIFSFNTPILVQKRLAELSEFFYATKQEVVDMVTNNTDLILLKNFSTIKERVIVLSKLFNTDERIIKSYVRRFPAIIKHSSNSRIKNIEQIQTTFNINMATMVDCFHRYPLFILTNVYKPPKTFLQSLDIKRPYLLNFHRRNYCSLNIAYKTILETIEKLYGVIEDAFVQTFESFNFGYLVVKANNPNKGYYLIGIGDDRLNSNNPSQEMIFNVYEYYNINGFKGYISMVESPLSKEFDDLVYQISKRRYYDVKKYESFLT